MYKNSHRIEMEKAVVNVIENDRIGLRRKRKVVTQLCL